MSQFVSQQKERLTNSNAESPIADSVESEKIPLADRAAWLLTARVMMNLDEFITRE
jgi:hypothetical protein